MTVRLDRPDIPDVIVSGWPPKEFRFTGEWFETEIGPRNTATRNRRVVRLPMYRAPDGEFFYSAQYGKSMARTRDHFDNESDAFKKLFSAVGEFLDTIEDEYEYDEDSIDNAPYNEDSYWRE